MLRFKNRKVNENMEKVSLHSEDKYPGKEFNRICLDAGLCNVIINDPDCGIIDLGN